MDDEIFLMFAPQEERVGCLCVALCSDRVWLIIRLHPRSQMLDLGGHTKTSFTMPASCHLHKHCFSVFLDHIRAVELFDHINQQRKPPTDKLLWFSTYGCLDHGLSIVTTFAFSTWARGCSGTGGGVRWSNVSNAVSLSSLWPGCTMIRIPRGPKGSHGRSVTGN